jgi:two-component system, sporulation sensor kinase D
LKFFKSIAGFEIYSSKQRWKLFLLIFAALIVVVSLYYTDILVKKVAEDERQKVLLWADAVQRRASLVVYTEELFENIKDEERKRVELWAMANQKVWEPTTENIDNFFLEILQSNTTIPVLATDDRGNVITHRNLDPEFGDPQQFDEQLKSYFSVYDPIPITYYSGISYENLYIYYQDSHVFTELQSLFDDLIESFISEVVVNSANVPVIIVDNSRRKIIAAGNIDQPEATDTLAVRQVILSLADKNPPITIQLPMYGTCHVFYTNSFLLTQLKYYPIAQFLIIGIFLIVAYVLFSTSRNAEQNQVWVGMSKETAHQLGTPLSSLVGWIEILKMKGVDKGTIREITKDVKRLENITERFSKIGSPAKLVPVNIIEVTREAVEYMKNRTSKKVIFKILASDKEIMVPLNTNLYEWVIENICKNAVDAMDGVGNLTIEIEDQPRTVIIDITDNGKGIVASKHKTIFNPGYTSKQRGWGLGLSLSKRIIENYHRGKLFVKSSEVNKGTTFRIIFNK